jgi:phage terminase large subunit-like protein
MAKRRNVFFSGEEPESLRGPQAEMVIVDEIARMRYPCSGDDCGVF